MKYLVPSNRRFAFRTVLGTVAITYAILIVLVIASLYLFPTKDRSREFSLLFSTYYYIKVVVNTIFFAGFYYYALNFFYHLIGQRKGFFYYLATTLLLTTVYFVYMSVSDRMRPGTIEGVWSPGAMIVFFVMCLFLSAAPALLIAFIVYTIDEKKHRKLLEAQKGQLEIEKAHANLNFLKAQINPHFLHNTLNFLYARSLPYSPELSEGILTLSEIMRYALTDPNLTDGKAALKDEIEHLRNVIRIHQLRFNNDLQVQFEVNGVVNGVHIIPFVLITLVENAFKHGDLKSTGHPITIRLSLNGTSLQFYCSNKKKQGPKEMSTGIGLDNIKKRLELAYMDRYSLDIKDEQHTYTTQLTIHAL